MNIQNKRPKTKRKLSQKIETLKKRDDKIGR